MNAPALRRGSSRIPGGLAMERCLDHSVRSPPEGCSPFSL